jgi:RNase P subunit RPR2
VSLFAPKCPLCKGVEWRSYAKDDNGVNLLVQCLKCGTIRERLYTPAESIQ